MDRTGRTEGSLVLAGTLAAVLAAACAGDAAPPAGAAGSRTEASGLAGIFVATTGDDANPGTFAQPVETLEGARNLVRAQKQKAPLAAPLNVYLRGGTYTRTEPFVLGPEDSGTQAYPITYRAFPDEKAVVSGGVPIKGWTQITNDRWMAKLPDEAGDEPRSLFVNGKRAVRARSPNTGYFLVEDVPPATKQVAFEFDGSDIDAGWSHLTDVEVINYRLFAQSRFRIDHVTGQTVFFEGSLQGTSAYAAPGGGYFGPAQGRYYVENALQELDAAGEWFWNPDSSLLLYHPLPGENMTTAEVIVPVAPSLVEARGQTNVLDLSGSFTVAHWVRTASAAAQLFTFANTASGNGYRFGLGGQKIVFLIGDSSASFTEVTCGPLIGTVPGGHGGWSFIAGVFDRDAEEFRCYVNGTYQATVPFNHAGGYPGMDTKLPRIPGPCCSNHFIGDIDELTVLSRAADADDISDLYDAQDATYVPVDPEDVRLAMHFDGDLEDASANLDNLEVQLGPAPTFAVDGIGGQALRFSTAPDPAPPGDGTTTDRLRWSPVKAYVTDVRFADLTFAHTEWELPEGGYPGGIAGHSATTPPALLFEHTNRCAVTDSEIVHTGGTGLRSDSLAMNVARNEIADTGGGGVRIGPLPAGFTGGLGPFLQDNWEGPFVVGGNTVTHNEIHDTNAVYKEAAAVLVVSGAYHEIAHNHIHDATASGVYVGWTWSPTESTVHHNRIEQNLIENVMEELQDLGGIYTLGRQDGTVIDNNVVRHVRETDFHSADVAIAAIYLDQGSKNITVQNNVVHDVGVAFLQHATFDDLVQNNVFAGATEKLWFFTVCDVCTSPQPTGNRLRRNIVYDVLGTPLIAVSAAVNPVSVSARNLFYSTAGPTTIPPSWLALGLDTPGMGTILVDPLFVDYDDDLDLDPGSPALAAPPTGIGFVPIDTSDVGP